MSYRAETINISILLPFIIRMIKDILKSMRPHQWYKNLIIFVCIIFSLNYFNLQMWITTISAFIVFCLLSGAQYIINDILDKEKDIHHPTKKNRPIASGKLKISHAIVASSLFLALATIWAYLINWQFLIVGIGYFILSLSYSLYLKNLVVVDVLTISIGFVLRATAGCVAINVFISPWLIICTFLAALFLALGKRRHELILLDDKANKHRKSLDGVSPQMLDQMITIVTAALIMSYSLYTFLAENILMMVTIPITIYGTFRYLFLIHSKNIGGEPEMLFKDKSMITSMVVWGITVILIFIIG
ncbi:decaprenyl-phosphate phosphoribosyltransferase [Methanolobus sp. WCC4]|uniref:decaprenyl-phosphate phosphoribosyltransferase n=1 Tax=Methanolobus sp. WCC4 TaxID=3125784 RepID=UPI0030F658C1